VSDEYLGNAINIQREKLYFSNKLSENVGNKMHYPMFILMNGANAENALKSIRKDLKLIWTNSYDKILFVKVIDSERLKFVNINDESADKALDFYDAYVSVRKEENSDYHVSMNYLRLYNIIDTSVINNIEEFISLYSLNNKISEQDDISNIQALSIVLLDETNNARLSKNIKKYLVDNSQNNCTLLLSTKTKNSTFTEVENLYETVSGSIIVSNNDAETTKDNQGYLTRSNCLMGKKGQIISAAHSVVRKPTKEIVIQIYLTIVEKAEQEFLNRTVAKTTEEWKKILGFPEKATVTNCQITSIEKILDILDIVLNISEIEYFPFKTIPKISITSDMQVSEFKEYIYDNYFDDYVFKIFNDKYKDNILLIDALNKYKQEIMNKVPAFYCKFLNKELIDEIVDSYYLSTPTESSDLKSYFRNSIKRYIRKYVVVPYLKDTLSEMKDSSESTIIKFKEYGYGLKNLIINQEKFETTVGIYYKNLTLSYLNSINGEKELKKILRSGNAQEEFLVCCSNIMDQIIIDDVKNGNSIFDMPLVEEWKKRLNKMDESDILGQIIEIFKKDLDQRFYFYTASTIPKKIITSFTLHLGNSKWEQPTSLYNSLQLSEKDSTTEICYINAGYDHKVEAFEFYDVTERLLFS